MTGEVKLEERTTAVPAARRHIIRRPRLTRMLDESGARIILLVAPAGYGKTTLAQQWIDESARRASWYVCTTASADVAALAAGVAESAARIVGGAGARMTQRLVATERPQEDARILAEMLAADLTEWPEGAWLVIDDYHLASRSSAAEAFVEALIEEARVNLMVTSRSRPSWAAARKRLYGKIFELDRLVLAMTKEEALSCLPAREGANDFISRAAGWAAVVGLAAVSDEALTTTADTMPSALYDYFAEELYQAGDPAVRNALCQLALIPSARIDAVRSFLDEEARRSIPTLKAMGLPSASVQSELDLHPLFREFLERKLRERDPEDVAALVERAGRRLLDLEAWDEAYALAARFNHPLLLLDLISEGSETLLRDGRLATVWEWLQAAAENHLRSTAIDLAEAEIALRQGDYEKVIALAEYVLSEHSQGEVARTRPLLLAGRAAHLRGTDEEALQYHLRAYETATSTRDKQGALWGQCLSLLDLEAPGADRILDELESISGRSADDVVRIATASCHLQIRQGIPIGARAEAARHLLPRVADPMVRSAFLNAYGGFLTFVGDYAAALHFARQQAQEASDFRLDFTLPHAQMREAAALAGLRRFAEAHVSLDCAEAAVEGTGVSHLARMVAVSRAALLVASGRADRVIVPRVRHDRTTMASLDGELLATWGLAQIGGGNAERALLLANQAMSRTNSSEAHSIARFAHAIAIHARDAERGRDLIAKAAEEALRNRNVNSFVLAYRACPVVLAILAPRADDFGLDLIVHRARDHALAQSVGLSVKAGQSRGSPLTKREAEVFYLLAQGHTNKQIAQALFISESTVKVHVRRILEKSGAQSRTEAVSRLTASEPRLLAPLAPGPRM